MCVTPQHFAEQLEVLRQHAEPVSLRELVRKLRDGKLPRRGVVLTLDDGYTDNLYHAKPLLEHYRIPATAFVTTGHLGSEFWWDELARILLAPTTLPARLSLTVNGGSYKWALSDATHIALNKSAPSPRQHLLLSLYKQLLSLSSAQRHRLMTQLRTWAGPETDDELHSHAMTADEVIQLATGNLVDIGAHSVTHPVLATLPLPAQQSEIQRSKSCLQELLDRPVTSFSYPNGSLSENTVSIVRESGFACACASYNDVVWWGSNRFHLPRFWVPNWNGAKFSHWLETWLSN